MPGQVVAQDEAARREDPEQDDDVQEPESEPVSMESAEPLKYLVER
jgi:hypothetical protein